MRQGVEPPRLFDDAAGQLRVDPMIDDDQEPDVLESVAQLAGDLAQRPRLAPNNNRPGR
jgi:hypothetical protein